MRNLIMKILFLGFFYKVLYAGNYVHVAVDTNTGAMLPVLNNVTQEFGKMPKDSSPKIYGDLNMQYYKIFNLGGITNWIGTNLVKRAQNWGLLGGGETNFIHLNADYDSLKYGGQLTLYSQDYTNFDVYCPLFEFAGGGTYIGGGFHREVTGYGTLIQCDKLLLLSPDPEGFVLDADSSFMKNVIFQSPAKLGIHRTPEYSLDINDSGRAKYWTFEPLPAPPLSPTNYGLYVVTNANLAITNLYWYDSQQSWLIAPLNLYTDNWNWATNWIVNNSNNIAISTNWVFDNSNNITMTTNFVYGKILRYDANNNFIKTYTNIMTAVSESEPDNTLYVGDGEYLVNAIMYPTNGLKIIGRNREKARFNLTANGVYIYNSSNVIDNITFYSAVTSSDIYAIYIRDNITNLVIRNCNFTIARGRGIVSLYYATGKVARDVWVENCIFNGGAIGMILDNSQAYVKNCIIIAQSNTFNYAQGNVYGVMIGESVTSTQQVVISDTYIDVRFSITEGTALRIGSNFSGGTAEVYNAVLSSVWRALDIRSGTVRMANNMIRGSENILTGAIVSYHPLNVGHPTATNHAVTKAYVDAISSPATKKTHRYVDRGDPANYDFTTNNIIQGNVWRDLSLAHIVPTNTVLVHLITHIRDNLTRSRIDYRRKDNTNVYNKASIETQAVNLFNNADSWVAVTNQMIQYLVSTTGVDFIYITVRGWFVEE